MIKQGQHMKMQQKLTPQQLMLMKLLQLPVPQLEQRIKDEVEKNPMLEMDEDAQGHDDLFGDTDATSRDGATDDDTDDFRWMDMDNLLDDDDYSYRERVERDLNDNQRGIELGDSISFQQTLFDQLDMQRLPDRDKIIGREIIGSIDGSGYLGRSVDLIANDLTFRTGIDVEPHDVERVLRVIQAMEPAGVGARSLQECMALQLGRMRGEQKTPSAEAETLALASLIVQRHFDDLGAKRYPQLLSALCIDQQTLNEALAVIRHLNPKPGWGNDEPVVRGGNYAVPDFIVTHDGADVRFALSSRSRPRLVISTEYSDMLQQLSTRSQLSKSERETRDFIKEKTQQAQVLIDTLSQREKTMCDIMGAIVRRQQPFLLSGDPSDLHPMRLKDVSDDTGFDESTISRVVNEKYVQTDFGTMLLKNLFSKAVTNDEGQVFASEHIKKAIRDTIDAEDKGKPLTDEALAAALARKGFNLSRRTVSKYRENLGIPVGRLRKEP